MLYLLRRSSLSSWIAGSLMSPTHLRLIHVPSSSISDFTVSFLENSCGLTRSEALSAASKINIKSNVNAESVISLLRSRGFTSTDIAKIICKFPRLLFCDTERIIKPKLDFFADAGVSDVVIAKLICSLPSILRSSLEKKLRPNFYLLWEICGSDQEFLGKINRFSWFFQRNFEKEIFPNLKILKDHGVSQPNIVKFFMQGSQSLLRRPAQFNKLVISLKEMGFNPSAWHFIIGLKVICVLSKSTWERKLKIYQSLGWSTGEAISAFKKFPICMLFSDEKIRRVLGFFVETLNWTPSYVAAQPVLLSYSIENTILPRYNILNILVAKGLLKRNPSMATLLRRSEKHFVENYVMKYKDQEPEILKAYKDKLVMKRLNENHSVSMDYLVVRNL